MRLFLYPPTPVTVSVPPIEFSLDGVDTTVSRDTATPANSDPLPIIQLDQNGDPMLQPLTDSELRASAVPVSMASAPLPTGAATEARQDTQITELQDIEADIEAGNVLLTTISNIDFATEAKQDSQITELQDIEADIEAGNVLLTTISNIDFATEAKQDSQITELQDIETDIEAGNVLLGAVNETAPASDTASSGLNGRLQRIAQRITSLIALIPASLGQKASADSFATVLSTEQETILTAIRDGVRSSVPNGSTQSNSTVSTTAANVAIPANTVGFIIQGYTGNAGLYWSLGATAANDGSSGHKLEDSRDSGFIPYAGTGNLSVIGEAASTRYQITWFTRS
jgi:hypothetical protein